MVKCGRCESVKDLWLVNPEGGYGREALWACILCLKGEWSGMVPRLLEVYPDTLAHELREALDNP